MKVVFRDLPCDIDGCTVESSEDGELYYTIIINSRLSAERKFEAYGHEIEHVRRSDFEKVRKSGVTKVECERAGIRQ